jgi:predicted MFS family arabinose efflux permease
MKKESQSIEPQSAIHCTSSDESRSPTSNVYRNYVLLMLTLVYVFNFVDRQILVILQESIKNELMLSDTQLGLLSGLSFALFYVVLGIPIARFADRGNRRNVVAIAVVAWSAMTALCGLAQNYLQLVLARIGVGVGEAGCSPPAHSMISDYFAENQRATALSVYSMGIYIGILFGFSLGGWLDTNYGWRMAFLALGLPGVIFAIFFFLTVKEPKRGLTVNQVNSSSFLQVTKVLSHKRSFVYLAFAAGLHSFGTYALGNWLPSFLERLHGLPKAEIGLYAGLILGIAGASGTLLGGYLADRLGKKDKRWYVKVPAFGAIAAIPFLLVYYFHSSTTIVLAALSIAYCAVSLFLGPAIAITHSLVPANMRAFASAVLFLVLNLIGLGLGPLFVGAMSDWLAPYYGLESLRFALASTLLVSVVAITLFFLAGRHIQQDLDQLEKLRV